MPEIELTRHATHDESDDREEPNLGEPVRLPFADKSFNVSYVTDTYEHIPAALREAEGALVEAFRVADARAVEELKARLQEINQLRH